MRLGVYFDDLGRQNYIMFMYHCADMHVLVHSFHHRFLGALLMVHCFWIAPRGNWGKFPNLVTTIRSRHALESTYAREGSCPTDRYSKILQ